MKWNVSWRNLLMYNAVIPDISTGSSSEGGGSSNNKSVSGSMSFFDVGKRLQEGKGV